MSGMRAIACPRLPGLRGLPEAHRFCRPSPGRKGRVACTARAQRGNPAPTRAFPLAHFLRGFGDLLRSWSSSSSGSCRNKSRLCWSWGECRPLRGFGFFLMRPPARSRTGALDGGFGAAASCHLPLVPCPQKKTPITRSRFLRGCGPSLGSCCALLLFFLANLIFYLVQGVPPAYAPAPAPKLQKSTGSPQASINGRHAPDEVGRQMWPGAGSHPRADARGVQAETSAPSDAWQT